MSQPKAYQPMTADDIEQALCVITTLLLLVDGSTQASAKARALIMKMIDWLEGGYYDYVAFGRSSRGE